MPNMQTAQPEIIPAEHCMMLQPDPDNAGGGSYENSSYLFNNFRFINLFVFLVQQKCAHR